ncbi:MAG: 6-phosphogluconolactonase [Pseudomonas sp.]|uniref:6-phosphogluconolactonase n=1 Tax=Pseudomonas sp. TaxID=306 RepID=UPI00339A3C51
MAISELSLPAGVSAHDWDTPRALAQSLAEAVATALRAALEQRGSATLVVSGGRSPIAFFEALSSQSLEWPRVLVSLADERWVPVEHPDSNAGLVRRHLLRGEAARARFLGLYRNTDSLEEAAALADQLLADLPTPIDVLVLGMGDDGHTASLFPHSPNLPLALRPDCPRRCVAMLAPSVPHQRLSMTLPLLASARHAFLALQGASKQQALAQALAGADPQAMPIRALLRAPLQIYWCP